MLGSRSGLIKENLESFGGSMKRSFSSQHFFIIEIHFGSLARSWIHVGLKFLSAPHDLNSFQTSSPKGGVGFMPRGYSSPSLAIIFVLF